MNEKEKHSFFKVLFRAIPIQFKAAPYMSNIILLIAVVHALAWTVSVIATQGLFDAISEAATGHNSFAECILPLLLLASITFGQQILNGVHNFFWRVVQGKSVGRIKSLLHRKLLCVDSAHFEDTAFHDDLNKAKEGIHIVTFFVLDFLHTFFFYGVYFASVGAYLYNLNPMLPITIFIAFAPALLAMLVRIKVFAKLEEQSAPIRREYEYYQKVMCDREYFKETRILGAFTFFHKLFCDTMLLLTKKTWQAERKTALLQLSLNTFSFAGMAISAYMLFAATMAGEITVGAFAAVFSALSMIFGVMQEIVNMHLGNMTKDVGKVANLVRMLDMPERTGAEGAHDFAKGITAENISFTYPGRDEPAVKGVSLTIANGETIAIVGENGAGKSTLVRLLTGIYRPTEGKVTVGGLDTAETAPASVYKGISGVFQKFQRYKMTLEENVTISDAETVSSERLKTA